VIVLSHEESFYAAVGRHGRDQNGPRVEVRSRTGRLSYPWWDVKQDYTPSTPRHALLRQYLKGEAPNNRHVAQAFAHDEHFSEWITRALSPAAGLLGNCGNHGNSARQLEEISTKMIIASPGLS